MVNVESYIKVGDDFVPLGEFVGHIPDPMYIEGAIELEVNGAKIMTRELWDDVNWLWSYIANGVKELSERHYWETHFPDQPIKLSLTADKSKQFVKIEITIPKREQIKASANYYEFVTALCEAGRDFCHRMTEIVPNHSSEFSRDKQKFEAMLNHVR